KEVYFWPFSNYPVNAIIPSGQNLYLLQKTIDRCTIAKTDTGEVEKEFSVKNALSGAALSDGSAAILCDNPMRIEVYNRGKLMKKMVLEHTCVPNSLAADRDGNFYVSDTKLARIIKISNDGREMLNIELTEKDGALNWGGCLAVDGGENIYICDNYGNFTVFNKEGRRTAGWKAELAGKLNYYRMFVIGPDNNIYIMDRDNHRILVYTTGGKYLGRFTQGSNRKNRMYYPGAIASDDRYIYVYAINIFTYLPIGVK
ncbi:MAG: NHL repeat-containing protein, partial [Spirochaetia bacterium]|nr:NHL repeat-containing protein [Spirochaetia bacterium]